MTASRSEQRPRSHPLAMFSAWFLVVFLILFPKGGVKLVGIPLTWGYMYLGLTAPILLLVRLAQMSLRLPLRVILVLAMLLPFQSLYLYAGFAYGVAAPGETISNFTSFFIFPLIFLLIYPPFLGYIDGVRLSRYFRWSILLAALWGLFLFFWRPFTGHFVEIPYLTVNAGDYGLLESTKNISRGFYSKLIATYNNGNLYGVATLILLPLYQTLERKRWRKGLVLCALFLTLARTVWFGLVLAEALPLFVVLARQVRTFPVVFLGRASKSFIAVALSIGMVFVALLFSSGAGLNFLFDPSAGGRTVELTGFTYATLFPEVPLRAFWEVVYASVAADLGWVGLIAFTLLMVSPLAVLLVDRSALRSPTRTAAFQGLCIYAILAWIDGAIQLIPVMAFYWFAYMIYLFGWPNEAKALAADTRKPVPTGTGKATRPLAFPVWPDKSPAHAQGRA